MLGGITFRGGAQARACKGHSDSNEAIGLSTTQLNLGCESDLTGVPCLTLTGRVIYASSQYCNAANPQCSRAWTRLDLGARYRARIAGLLTTVRARVENLADRNCWAAASSAFGVARRAPSCCRQHSISEVRPRTLKRWQWPHTWTSLGCAVSLPALCLTGLPLIFSQEIEDARCMPLPW